MEFSPIELQEALKEEYNMDSIVEPLSQSVTFFGSELDCYKMAYKLKALESTIECVDGVFSITFPYWYDIKFSQRISD